MVNLIKGKDKLFRDLKLGEKFEVYGDVHLNYNYSKICKCTKTGDEMGTEVDGINFAMGGNETVFAVEEYTV